MQPLQTVKAVQYTAWYDPREDRLRLAANLEATPEMRADFWITRRFFLSMVLKVEGFLEQNFGEKPQEAVEEVLRKNVHKNRNGSEIPEAKSEGNAQAQSVEKRRRPDLGVEAVLLETMNLTADKERGIVVLTLEGGGRKAVSQMRAEEMLAFLKMLVEQAPSMEWGVSSLLLR